MYAQTTNKLLGHLGTEDSVFAIIRFADSTVVNLKAPALPAGSRTLLDAKMSILSTKGLIEIECGESDCITRPKRLTVISTPALAAEPVKSKATCVKS